MDALDGLSKSDIRDLLGKGWLTHDGMWFYHTSRELGMEKANKINKAAISALAPIEVKRMLGVLGVGEEEIDSMEDLKSLMLAGLEITLPRSVFSRVHFSYPGGDVISWEWDEGECFAYKGMKQIGVIDEYSCGVMFRIECWLRALGVKYEIEPVIEGCLMHETGSCRGDIRISSRMSTY